MDLSGIGAWAGEHGPYVGIIIFLLRSLAKKDETIERMTESTMELAKMNKSIRSIVRGETDGS